MVREISWRRFLSGSPGLSGDAAPSSDRGAPAEQGKISLFGHIETAVLKRRSDGLVDPARRAEAEVVVVHGKLIPAMFARLIAKIGFGYAVGWLGLDLIEPTVVDTVLHKGTAINQWWALR